MSITLHQIIIAHKERIAELEAKNAELEAHIQQLTAENDSLSESIAVMEEVRAEVSAAMQERIDDLEAANAELRKAQYMVARQRIEELEEKFATLRKVLEPPMAEAAARMKP